MRQFLTRFLRMAFVFTLCLCLPMWAFGAGNNIEDELLPADDTQASKVVEQEQNDIASPEPADKDENQLVTPEPGRGNGNPPTTPSNNVDNSSLSTEQVVQLGILGGIVLLILFVLYVLCRQSSSKRDLKFLVTQAQGPQKPVSGATRGGADEIGQLRGKLDELLKIVKKPSSQVSSETPFSSDKIVGQLKPYFEDVKRELKNDIERGDSSIKNELKGGTCQRDLLAALPETIESNVKKGIELALPELQKNFQVQYASRIQSLLEENNRLTERLRESDSEWKAKMQHADEQNQKELSAQEERLRKEMTQKINEVVKKADERVAAAHAESEHAASEAEKRIAVAVADSKSQVQLLQNRLAIAETAIYPAELNNDPDFIPLKEQLNQWLEEDAKDAVAIIRNSLGLFCERKEINKDSWQLALKNVSVGIVLAMSQTTHSMQEIYDILVAWAKYLTKFGRDDAEYLFNLQLPGLGKPIDKSWMSLPKNSNATTVKKICSWAVYNQYGVRYNAEVE